MMPAAMQNPQWELQREMQIKMDSSISSSQTFPGNSITFISTSNVKMKECVDGTSNTLLVGEISNFIKDAAGRAASSSDDLRPGRDGGWTMGSHTSWSGAWMLASIVINYPPNSNVYGQIGVRPGEAHARYNYPLSSAHVGGAQVLFADGTVRLIGNNIDMNTLKHLAARNDAQTVSDF